MPRHRTRLISCALAIPLALDAAACADASMRVASFIERDSAGITIASNASPLLTGEESWAVGSAPILTIGDEQNAEQQLFRVRAARMRSDGSIAIANSGTFEVRVYAPDGRLLHRVGREGQGPGELQYLENVWTPGDSLFLWDGSATRVLVHDETGAFLRTVQLGPHVNAVTRVPGDGGFIGYTNIHDRNPRALNETWWEDHAWVRYDAEGDSLNVIGPLPGAEYVKSDWQGNELRAQRALGASSRTAIDRDVFYFGDARSFRILAFDYTGRPSRIIEREHSPGPATAEVRAAHIQSRIEAAPSAELGQAYAAYFVGYPFPETLPAYDAMIVDGERNLWVREWTLAGSVETNWSVFTPQGRWLTDVKLPAGDVLEIGSDYLLMLQRSELGVEQVSMYALSKGLSSSPTPSPAASATGLALDHVPIAVGNLDAAVQVFRDRLGFSIKPGRLHANSIRNAHVKFEDGTSLELITAGEPRDALASRYRQSIANGGGAEFVAFRPDSMDAIASALAKAGVQVEQTRSAYARLLEFDPDGPLGHVFLISLDTPPVDRAEHTTHANGAITLFAAWLHAAEDSTESVLLETAGAEVGDEIALHDGFRARDVDLGCGHVYRIRGGERPRRPIVGVTLAVTDLTATQQRLATAGVGVITGRDSRGGFVRVRPADANGIWLEFLEPSEARDGPSGASFGTRVCVPNRQRG